METTVAIFVVTLMIMAAVSVAVLYIKGRRSTTNQQQNVEEMTLALNQLAKEIRMSNCDTNDSGDCDLLNASVGNKDSIKIINNVSNSSVKYEFKNDKLYKDSKVMLSDVTGHFYVSPGAASAIGFPSGCSGASCTSYSAGNVKRITISIVSDKDGGAMTLQTTVSMRSGYNQ